MIQEMIQAFILIFVAEMGDKTQILAMAFATKYSVKKVLLGILVGSFLNHGLAVALGSQLTRIIPIDTIQIIAGLAFLAFAFWSLKPDDDEDEETKDSKFGAVATVAVAFFIGELGDKTQLTAITVASSASYPLLVLAGTVSGMVATGSLGIFVGKKLGDRIPEFVIKAVASVVFLGFGTGKLYASLPGNWITSINMVLYAVVIILPFIILISIRYRSYKAGVRTLYDIRSKALYDYYHQVNRDLEALCLGPGVCGNCEGKECPVGHSKAMMEELKKSFDQDGALKEVDRKTAVIGDLKTSFEEKSFDQTIADRIINATTELRDDEAHEDIKQAVIDNMSRLKKSE